MPANETVTSTAESPGVPTREGAVSDAGALAFAKTLKLLVVGVEATPSVTLTVILAGPVCGAVTLSVLSAVSICAAVPCKTNLPSLSLAKVAPPVLLSLSAAFASAETVTDRLSEPSGSATAKPVTAVDVNACASVMADGSVMEGGVLGTLT